MIATTLIELTTDEMRQLVAVLADYQTYCAMSAQQLHAERRGHNLRDRLIVIAGFCADMRARLERG